MSKKSILVIGAVLLLLIAGGVAYYVHSMSSADVDLTATDNAAAAPDKVNKDDHVMGSANAPVTMIEYFAQACSVCAHFDQDVFPLLKAKYIDTGKVRYVMRLFPLFPIDGPSYKLDLCVPPERFFQTADLLFRNQSKWDSAEYPVSDPHAGLIQMAGLLGLDPAQADACMSSKKYDDAINKGADNATAWYQPSGTPTFVLDFKKADIDFDAGDPTGSWQKVQAAIDAALAAKGAK